MAPRPSQLGLWQYIIRTLYLFSILQSLDANELVQNQCRNGNVSYVKAAMEEFGADAVFNATASHPSFSGWLGLTCLIMAAGYGQNDLVTLLLANGVEVDQREYFERTALHNAALSGHAKTTMILLDAGAEIDARDHFRQTALHYAAGNILALNNHTNTITILLDAGAEVDARDEHGQTALHWAVKMRHGHTNATRILVDAGAEVDARDFLDWTPLHEFTSWDNAIEISNLVCLFVNQKSVSLVS